MVQPPKDMLGAVAAKSKIHGIAGGVVFAPHGGTGLVETMGD